MPKLFVIIHIFKGHLTINANPQNAITKTTKKILTSQLILSFYNNRLCLSILLVNRDYFYMYLNYCVIIIITLLIIDKTIKINIIRKKYRTHVQMQRNNTTGPSATH